MPQSWRALAKAVGGVDTLAAALDISRMQLYRLAHGRARAKRPVMFMIEEMAKQHGVPSPLAPEKDLAPLEHLGGFIARNLYPATPIAHARKTFGEEDLVNLAERDDVSENVLRAVMYLLENQ